MKRNWCEKEAIEIQKKIQETNSKNTLNTYWTLINMVYFVIREEFKQKINTSGPSRNQFENIARDKINVFSSGFSLN